jgi:hypothetical protein
MHLGRQNNSSPAALKRTCLSLSLTRLGTNSTYAIPSLAGTGTLGRRWSRCTNAAWPFSCTPRLFFPLATCIYSCFPSRFCNTQLAIIPCEKNSTRFIHHLMLGIVHLINLLLDTRVLDTLIPTSTSSSCHTDASGAWLQRHSVTTPRSTINLDINHTAIMKPTLPFGRVPRNMTNNSGQNCLKSHT